MKKIKLFDPYTDKFEKIAINRVLKSNFWASGAGNGNGVTGNVAIGYQAGTGPTDNSNENIAIGTNTIKYVKGTASANVRYNVAIGYEALHDNTTGTFNAAVGREALSKITTASQSTGLGVYAGRYATNSANTFVGYSAGEALNEGDENIFIMF